jgi:uncharacterized protein Yka (UPF0111/DUF47 family)
MTPEQRRELHAIINAHDDAIGALRAANRQILSANTAFTAMVEAHDDAIQAAMAANQAALRLLNALE